jgi:hypothetical protein
LRLDRGVSKEMKEKIKYLKKGQSTYCRKGQILVQVWWHKRDVTLIWTLHTANTVETEKKRNGETMKKPEIIQDYKKFMRGVDRAD